MSTTVQIEANRANAALSTGPSSEAGKAASSYNALKSGFTSALIWVAEDELEDFNRLKAGLLDGLKPEGQLERHFFDAVLHASWYIQMCMSEESSLLKKGAFRNPDLAKHLDRINRYRRSHELSLRRALAELQRLQSERIFRRESRRFQSESVLVQTRPSRTGIVKTIGQPRPQPQTTAAPSRAA